MSNSKFNELRSSNKQSLFESGSNTENLPVREPVRNTIYSECFVGEGRKRTRIVLTEKRIEDAIRNFVREYDKNLNFELVIRLVKNGEVAYIFVKNTEVYNLLFKLNSKDPSWARVEEIDEPIFFEFKEGEEPDLDATMYEESNNGYLEYLDDWNDWYQGIRFSKEPQFPGKKYTWGSLSDYEDEQELRKNIRKHGHPKIKVISGSLMIPLGKEQSKLQNPNDPYKGSGVLTISDASVKEIDSRDDQQTLVSANKIPRDITPTDVIEILEIFSFTKDYPKVEIKDGFLSIHFAGMDAQQVLLCMLDLCIEKNGKKFTTRLMYGDKKESFFNGKSIDFNKPNYNGQNNNPRNGNKQSTGNQRNTNQRSDNSKSNNPGFSREHNGNQRNFNSSSSNHNNGNPGSSNQRNSKPNSNKQKNNNLRNGNQGSSKQNSKPIIGNPFSILCDD